MAVYNKQAVLDEIDKQIDHNNRIILLAEEKLRKDFAEWKKTAPAKFKAWVATVTLGKDPKDIKTIPPTLSYSVTQRKRSVEQLQSSKKSILLMEGDTITERGNKNLLWFI